MAPKGRVRVAATGPRGKLGSLQKIAVASGLLNGHSNTDIATQTGLNDTQVAKLASKDVFIGGLIRGIVTEHAEEIRELMTITLCTIRMDLTSGEPGRIDAGRRDYTRIVAIASNAEKDQADPESQRPVVVINLPATLPVSLPQVVKSSNR